MVGSSRDGGLTWQWNIVEGYNQRDFRDVVAFSESTAILIAVGTPAYILKTTNGGKTFRPKMDFMYAKKPKPDQKFF